jgi:hypothetical protein
LNSSVIPSLKVDQNPFVLEAAFALFVDAVPPVDVVPLVEIGWSALDVVSLSLSLPQTEVVDGY